MQDCSVSSPAPLQGKTVALVHPAWHSCGSHQVFVSQARAYRTLGASVVALAVHDTPAPMRGAARDHYVAKTADLIADQREWAAMPLSRAIEPGFLRALGRRGRGDHATLRMAVAERAKIPDGFPKVDLVHCNHFFCMPVATRVARSSSSPIILDSHDIQARQYSLANDKGWTVPPTVSFAAMLEVERAAMQRADLLIHLNDEEDTAFQALLPDKRHGLVYPAISPVALGTGGRDLVLVAASNHANFESVDWFLREVLPLAPNLPVRIVGAIAHDIKRLSPELYRRNVALFTERVDDIASVYETAAAILLPTVAGHGISIKTIEALSTGARLIATPHAFRGMAIDPTTLSNVSVTTAAETFASAMRSVAEAAPIDGRASDTRRLYDTLFSPRAYAARLAEVVMATLAR